MTTGTPGTKRRIHSPFPVFSLRAWGKLESNRIVVSADNNRKGVVKHMRRFWIPVVFALGSAALAVQGAKWSPFKSAEGKFSISLPGTPQTQSQPVNTAVGEVQMNLFIVPIGNETVYFVAFSDYPADKMKNASSDKVLNGCRDGMVGNQKGTMTSDKAFKLGGVPGRDFAWKGGNDFDGMARIYLKQNRLYQVMVLRKKGTPLSKDFTKFFASFKIL